jgi:hypothetical protein
MSKPCLCYQCGKPTEVYGSMWCSACYRPDIDREWRAKKHLIEEAHTRHLARLQAEIDALNPPTVPAP